ncbi:MAG: hypothetical protein ACK5LC_15745, partial [Coprobacillaceae bacterium]
MKKLSIYWKTVGVSITIILITVASLFLLISIVAPNVTQSIQQEQFDSQVSNVVELVENKGIDNNELDSFLENGIYIEIYHKEELVYTSFKVQFNPNNEHNKEGDNATFYPAEVDDNSAVGVFTENTLEHEEVVQYNNEEFRIEITKTITFTVNDSYSLIKVIFPYFLLVGLVVAIILSVLYARFF